MKAKEVIVLFCLLVFVMFWPQAYGQQISYKFKHLSINDGLSQNTVFAMLQDHRGFIWIGTEDGLNRYDGYDFAIFKHQGKDRASISNNQVNALAEDQAGNLWIGTADGINEYDPSTNRFHSFYTIPKASSDSSDFITALALDKQGNLWTGTNYGLKNFTLRTKQVVDIELNGIKKEHSKANKVLSLLVTNDGMLWVGTNSDLLLYDTRNKHFVKLPNILTNNTELRAAGILKIEQDAEGNIWFATKSKGLFRLDAKHQTCNNYLHFENGKSLLSEMVRDVLATPDGQLWIGTHDGLNIIDKDKLNTFQYDKYDPFSLSHNSIRCLLQDRTGNIWIGTFAGGINVFYNGSNNFAQIGEQIGTTAGLSHRVVSALVNNGNNQFWIGTEGGGLNFYDKNKNIFKTYSLGNKADGFKGSDIKSLVKDDKGNLWVGAFDGLLYFNTKDHSQHIYKSTSSFKNSSENQIYALSADSNGVWIGTNGAGLQFMDYSGKISVYQRHKNSPNSISSNNINAIIKDSNGNLWIGTQRGLNYLNIKTQRFEQYRFNKNDEHSLIANSVLSLFEDDGHRIWVGSQGGLSLFDKERSCFYNITEVNGLTNTVVHAISQDKRGQLWISTNKGIFQVRINDLHKPLSSSNINMINYTVSDGLLSNQFSTGSSLRDEKGTLYFGSINGLAIFNPEHIFQNRNKPELVFTDFLIKNKSIEIGAENSPLSKDIDQTSCITLTYDQRFISFKFAALSFVNPDKNQYAYKMQGFKGEDDWHYVSNQRVASYTNLSPGSYVFLVKASNNDGLWNDTPRSVSIIVLPPWWQTWWAYTIYGLVIFSLLYSFNFYSLKTARLKSELHFEHLSHEKDKDLTQRKLTFFTNISHEIKTPLTLILSPLERLLMMNEGNNKVKNQLLLMQRNGERLLRLIDQLLDFRKFETGNLALKACEADIVVFINEIFISFEPYAAYKSISLKLNSTIASLNVYFDKDKLEIILYNLLSNAIKFTPIEGTIEINISAADAVSGYPEGIVIIEIKDNGCGIEKENIDKIFERFVHFSKPGEEVKGTGLGLTFSKDLVDLHKGELTVKSMVANGIENGETIFKVKLPLGSTHLTKDEIVIQTIYTATIIPDENKAVSVEKERSQDLDAEINLLQGEKPVMLIVEDNLELTEFIKSTFEEDYQVYTAGDGLIGWTQALEVIPDIVISDVMMPGLNGIGLCEKIKSDIRTSHIPVILLTARTPLAYKIEGLETGADDYIIKPFSVGILQTRVRNLIASRKLLRERYSKEINLQPQNLAITSPDEVFLKKVMAYIEKNMANHTLNVEDLGKEIGMGRVTLYRKIKALTNQTTVEFIRGVRIKRAVQLLEKDQFNINEVAYMVGFIDVDYFRKCFKEQYGYPPREHIGK